MEAVAKNGADWFYEGPVADEIVRQVNKYQGLLVKEDLTGCAPKERPVVRGTYRAATSSPCPLPPPAAAISSRCSTSWKTSI